MTMTINNMFGREDAWEIGRFTVTHETKSLTETKKKRTWKKPKDKPMRPLSAYNMFFQHQRERIIAGKWDHPTPVEIEASVTKLLKSKRGPKKRQDRITHGQISFADLARTIATRWKAIDPITKAVYNKFAAQEKIRYRKELVVWKEKKEKEFEATKMRDMSNSLLNSSTSLNDSVSSLESSVTSLPGSLSSLFNPSDSVNSLGPYFSCGRLQDNKLDDLSTSRQIRQSLQHQLQLEQKHQLLLHMQKQKYQKLRELEQARKENSRMGDMDFINLSQLRSLSGEHTNFERFWDA